MAKFKVEIIIDDGDYESESDLKQDIVASLDDRYIDYINEDNIKVEKLEE